MNSKAWTSLATSVIAVLGTVGALAPDQVASLSTLFTTIIAAGISFAVTWRVPNK